RAWDGQLCHTVVLLVRCYTKHIIVQTVFSQIGSAFLYAGASGVHCVACTALCHKPTTSSLREDNPLNLLQPRTPE
ncbi:hypothetical protein BGW80DRAFT_1307277, partial [Lactifluus volemus]